jgi:hypothetical protein
MWPSATQGFKVAYCFHALAILRAMFNWTTFLTSLAGSGLLSISVAKGLSGYFADRWMTRYKSELDKELEAYRDTLERKRKRIEAELGHRTYVSKTQFDTEFNAVKDCFSALAKLRLSFNGLRPFIDRTPDDKEGKVKLMVSRLNHFKERFNPFVDRSESVYPFIPEEIYVQFEICSKTAFLEINHIEDDMTQALTPTGYMEGAKQLQEFNAAYFTAAKLARERFRQISVVYD